MLNHMVAQEPEAIDRVFHALSHPARRAMLRSLAEGDRNVSELASPFEMSFPAASKHVRVLEEANLLSRRVEGRSHVCTLNAKPLREVADWAAAFQRFWDERFDALDAYLKILQDKDRADEPDAP